jgi:ATP-binding cassette, subfamily G (WHITE), member 2, PDR
MAGNDNRGASNALEQHDGSSSSETGSILRQTITTKSTASSRPDDLTNIKTELSPMPYSDLRELSRLATSFTKSAGLEQCATVAGMDMSDPRLTPNDPAFDFQTWASYVMRKLEDANMKRPRIDTTFRGLSVTGTGDAVRLHQTVGSMLLTPLGFVKVKKWRHAAKKTILHNFNGVIKSGELCIVLGRPGSGCSTFLKAVTGHLEGAEITKESGIAYNGIPQQDYVKTLRGEILYNQENESHFPHLTVGQTLEFAAAARAPSNPITGQTRNEMIKYFVDIALKLYGLSHARHTRVGDDYIRGVSGGERKRVSIAEMALTGALMGAWDNSTRGLDSATALRSVAHTTTSRFR